MDRFGIERYQTLRRREILVHVFGGKEGFDPIVIGGKNEIGGTVAFENFVGLKDVGVMKIVEVDQMRDLSVSIPSVGIIISRCAHLIETLLGENPSKDVDRFTVKEDQIEILSFEGIFEGEEGLKDEAHTTIVFLQ